MAIFYMHLQDKYFQLIKNGKKSLELRLYDEKRRELQRGDLIVFSSLENNTESTTTEITNFYKAKDFFQLCQNIDITQTGFNDKNELITALDAIYPLEKQQKYGVVAIELKLI